MLLRSWKRVVVGAPAVVAVLGVNALARSAPRSARSISAAHRSAVDPAQSVSAAHRAAAIANADQMLAAVVMPSGSTRETAAPGGAAAFRGTPDDRLFFEAQVDRHQFWLSKASETSIAESIESHLPAGSAFQISGGNGVGQSSSYKLPSVDPEVLGIRQLVVYTVPLSDDDTAVRVDAEVQYLAPWKPGQRIPAAAQFLQITKGPADSRSPRVVRTVTDPVTVRHIAALIEALPFEGNDSGLEFSCPDALATNPVDWFTFRAASQGPVLAELSEAATASNYPNPCDDPVLTIRGHDDPPIAGGGQLLKEVDRLLGVRLTAR